MCYTTLRALIKSVLGHGMHDLHYERVHRQLSACKFELVGASDREGTALLNSRLQSSN